MIFYGYAELDWWLSGYIRAGKEITARRLELHELREKRLSIGASAADGIRVQSSGGKSRIESTVADLEEAENRIHEAEKRLAERRKIISDYIDAHDTEEQLMRLRYLAGLSYEKIAETALYYNGANARRALMNHLKALAEESQG